MTTTIKYPTQGKSVAGAVTQPAAKNKYSISIVHPNVVYPIFSEQLLSVSSLDLLAGHDFIVEFEVDANGQILKTIRDIVDSGVEINVRITSLDSNLVENFSVNFLNTIIIGSSLSTRKDQPKDNASNLALTSFDLKSSDSLRVIVVFHYEDVDWEFPKVK